MLLWHPAGLNHMLLWHSANFTWASSKHIHRHASLAASRPQFGKNKHSQPHASLEASKLELNKGNHIQWSAATSHHHSPLCCSATTSHHHFLHCCPATTSHHHCFHCCSAAMSHHQQPQATNIVSTVSSLGSALFTQRARATTISPLLLSNHEPPPLSPLCPV